MRPTDFNFSNHVFPESPTSLSSCLDPGVTAVSEEVQPSKEGPDDAMQLDDFDFSKAVQDNIAAIARECKEHFPEKGPKIWDSPKALSDEVNLVGEKYGFLASIESSTVRCTRAAQTASYQKRQEKRQMGKDPAAIRNVQTLRCGCKFHIRYTKVKANKTWKAKHENAPDTAIRITSCNYYHSNGCMPGMDQLVQQKKRSGVYSSKCLTRDNLSNLINFLSLGPLPTNTIRKAMKQFLPPSLGVTATDVFNLRIRVQKYIDTGSTPSIDEAQGIVDTLQSAKGEFLPLDQQNPSFLDEASRLSKSLLREALSEPSTTLQLRTYLESLAQRDPGFRFKISFSSDNVPTGIVWQTPAMRRDVERYGDALFLDCMKRQQNSLHWPYIGPVLLDGDRMIRVGCEAIVCAEELGAYQFVVESMFEMTPNRSIHSVRVIFGDGFLTQSLIDRLGIGKTCHLVYDKYHLQNEDWPRQFGPRLFPQIKETLKNIMYSATKTDYEQQLNKLREELVRLNGRKHLDYVEREIHGHRHLFVKAWVATYEGNLELNGSSLAEQNHASFVQRIGPCSIMEPAEAICEMIQRQVHINSQRHNKLCNEHLRAVSASTLVLNNPKSSFAERQDALAKRYLSSEGFALWQEHVKDGHHYWVEAKSDGSWLVYRGRRGDKSLQPRHLRAGAPCNCPQKIAYYQAPCRHEVRLDEFKFVQERWGIRYERRPYLDVSLPQADTSEEASSRDVTQLLTEDSSTQIDENEGTNESSENKSDTVGNDGDVGCRTGSPDHHQTTMTKVS